MSTTSQVQRALKVAALSTTRCGALRCGKGGVVRRAAKRWGSASHRRAVALPEALSQVARDIREQTCRTGNTAAGTDAIPDRLDFLADELRRGETLKGTQGVTSGCAFGYRGPLVEPAGWPTALTPLGEQFTVASAGVTGLCSETGFGKGAWKAGCKGVKEQVGGKGCADKGSGKGRIQKCGGKSSSAQGDKGAFLAEAASCRRRKVGVSSGVVTTGQRDP
eukprot:CAMPEP_0204383646 /NCGR_PEP_ID=MMETSP0469-20131031/56184_1 /ASSEMBLY_ACC=CAM_ASM_000384 /TAXON_ID=2969 /ORGANISM="Oxyrrhis marina" /LENGTH=220 /DNA_ID=CAMNT_0051376043 /DNA_START=30 /DNA_END=693 /DNA_ORIENTATION=-